MKNAGHRSPEPLRNLVAFWLLGFVNNLGYVVMIAGAQEIAAGGVGLVYFFDIFPALLVKLSGPYWFHLVSYRSRTLLGALWMLLSFLVVAGGAHSLALQLLGVAFSGLQSGMMEASFLAMASLYDSQRCLTCWASGTGLAGVGGYAWVALLHLRLGLSFAATLQLAALVFPALYVLTFAVLLDTSRLSPATQCAPFYYAAIPESAEFGGAEHPVGSPMAVASRTTAVTGTGKTRDSLEGSDRDAEPPHRTDDDALDAAARMTVREKARFTLTLGPYMVPLVVVYLAEYTMQTGVWSTIGFPEATSARARAEFYSAAGLAYQFGVFLSRSSGVLCQATRPVLYLMPALQTALLVLFALVSAYHVLYDWALLVLLCFVAGLLGGGVYVNAFTLLSREVRPDRVELALSAASVGDTVGVMLADCAGLVLQGCLYSIHGIPGAAVQIQC
ncbi:hypothetical protein PybrP1_005660 [[Pythium] brassicae (nom. inval.)]|nr:hypothetical protein PybrP1_005660 [[Pythium] brassicae (nom. inval.)]